MSKPFYSEYVKHALRFYSRNSMEKPIFKSEADKNNWMSCHIVISLYPPSLQKIFIEVYSGFDTLPDEVYNASKKHDVDQTLIWDSMKDLERKIAKRRGLM